MANTIEQIKNRLGVVDVLGSYLKLEKAGINFKSRCPFHNEKTPSFFISPSRDSYYCFGCGKKGDIFNFVQDFEGVDFLGSLKILADRAGVTIEKIDPKLIDANQKVLSLLEDSVVFYENELKNNKEALEYLKGRGLKAETIKSFRLGFAPDDWRKLLDFLKNKGYKESQIEEAGLIKESKGNVYDRFRSRIMFPVNDSSGRPIAFSGRIWGEGDGEAAKYINSPETKFFKKSNNLFAYDKAKMEIRRNDFAILVEGNVDVLMAHQAGYKNTVAPLGTALTEEQVEKIGRLTKRLVIAFDSDGAGFKASSRGAKIALFKGMDLKITQIPDGYDPAELILKDGEGWKKAIRESKHIIEFYLDKVSQKEKDPRKLNLKIKEEVLPFVVMIENKIDQAHFVKLLAQKMEVPEQLVFDEIQKIDMKDLDMPYLKDSDKKAEEFEKNNKRTFLIKRIIGIILWQEKLTESQINIEETKKRLEDLAGESVWLLSKGIEEEIIFEAESSYTEKELNELFLRLKLDYLEEGRKDLNREDKKDEVLKEYHNISKEIEEIKEKLKND